MTDSDLVRRYRFGAFEADASSGELRKQGIRIRINAQPFQVLLMFLERPGEVLTREEISRVLWSDGTFVDYEHGVNSAVNRLRDALGDSAGNPRFVETLARKGYRFLAPVERIGEGGPVLEPESAAEKEQSSVEAKSDLNYGFLATAEQLPEASHKIVRVLFLLLQLMYLGFYVGALSNLPEIEDLLSPLPAAAAIVYIVIGTAAILIAVRAFLFCAVMLRAPQIAARYRKLWPWLLVADVLWALSPLLLLHHINIGVAIACMALLAYLPFAQRSLMLMGAGREEKAVSASAR